MTGLNSLKFKLTFVASLFILAGSLTVAIMAFRSELTILKENLTSRVVSSVDLYNADVANWFSYKRQSLRALPAQAKPDSLIAHLQQIRDSAGYNVVFLAYPDGSQLNSNNIVLKKDPNNPLSSDPRAWPWYVNAKASPGDVYVSTPNPSAMGNTVISLGVEVQLNGESRVLGADIGLDTILASMEKIALPGESEVMIVDSQGIIFSHLSADLLNQDVSVVGVIQNDIQQAMNAGQKGAMIMRQGEEFLLFAQPISGTELMTVTLINWGSLITPIYHTLIWKLTYILLFLFVCIAIFYLISIRLVAPLTTVALALDKIATGNGDLTQKLPVKSADEVGRLSASFNAFVNQQCNLIKNIRHEALALSDKSGIILTVAQRKSSELDRQSAEITQVATAVTQMAAAAQQIAQGAEQTAQAAVDSAQESAQSVQLVECSKASISALAAELQEAGGTTQELNTYAGAITQVLESIQDVAEQTNLLALNAAIEAARAGEHGRGFAVVADEVRLLSLRTQSSTEEIKVTIDKLQGMVQRMVSVMQHSLSLVDQSVESVELVNTSLENISHSTALINDMTNQIATAAQEQTSVTEEISRNMTSISDVTHEMVRGAREQAKGAQEQKQVAERLQGEVLLFKLD
ncbi:chemotaxis protein [Vibrio albus]|uniref:Chemotaxis protein n=1 Tax=Vibrio albus TaxID=2200953 RepID=A0A2U3B9H7_9VIBR|nr:methyl-accepting chemotaxis protein [Vibrio albus]PWI33432.1 chemotaxis protein [Vibrio albus]